MKAIIFQKLNFNYFFFLFYLIACLATSFIDVYSSNAESTDSNNETENNHFCNSNNNCHLFDLINIFAATLSDFFAIIPYLIKRRSTRQTHKIKQDLPKDNEESDRTSSISSTSSSFIYNNLFEDQISKKSKYLNIYSFTVSFLDFCADIILFFYYAFLYGKNEKNADYEGFFLLNSTVIFQIVFQYCLSKLILRTEFYKHHYLSIAINVVSFIIIFIIDIIDSKNHDRLFILFFSLYCIFLVLENTFGKKAMLYGYISPYTLLIYKGIFKLLLLIILSIIFLPTIYKINKYFFYDIYNDLSKNIIVVFLNFIFTFFKDLFNWILIDRFSPCHLALSLILEDISYLIIYEVSPFDNNENKNNAVDENKIEVWEGFIRVFIYVILFIAAMIHNEIFIINKWGLGNNTKLFLDEKEKEEKILSSLDDGDMEILKRYDTMIEMEENVKNEENENNNNEGIVNNDTAGDEEGNNENSEDS